MFVSFHMHTPKRTGADSLFFFSIFLALFSSSWRQRWPTGLLSILNLIFFVYFNVSLVLSLSLFLSLSLSSSVYFLFLFIQCVCVCVCLFKTMTLIFFSKLYVWKTIVSKESVVLISMKTLLRRHLRSLDVKIIRNEMNEIKKKE